MRSTVKYTNYSQFRSTSTILFNGKAVESAPDETKPQDKKPQ